MHNGCAAAGMAGWGCAIQWLDWIEQEIETFVVGDSLDTVSMDLGGHG